MRAAALFEALLSFQTVGVAAKIFPVVGIHTGYDDTKASFPPRLRIQDLEKSGPAWLVPPLRRSLSIIRGWRVCGQGFIHPGPNRISEGARGWWVILFRIVQWV